MTIVHIADVLAAVVGIAVVAMGIGYLAAPVTSASGFGLPAWPAGDTASWLNLKGIRDLVSGLVVLLLLAVGTPHVLGWYLVIVAITPIGDAITVLRNHGNRALAYGMHGGTAAVLVAIGVLLLLG